jgi:hypothetical protein
LVKPTFSTLRYFILTNVASVLIPTKPQFAVNEISRIAQLVVGLSEVQMFHACVVFRSTAAAIYSITAAFASSQSEHKIRATCLLSETLTNVL